MPRVAEPNGIVKAHVSMTQKLPQGALDLTPVTPTLVSLAAARMTTTGHRQHSALTHM